VANPENNMRLVDPAVALQEIADAVPTACRKHVIIIGSLAAGYYYRDQLKGMAVRTKDADCLLSPRVAALKAGIAIAEELRDAGWEFKKTKGHKVPGTEDTPDAELPAVRLSPPGKIEWFIELLTVPESPGDRGPRWTRLKTKYGDFVLPSFRFLSLANLDPVATEMGISIARPEMMALANLLEHPEIKTDTMSGGFADRMDIKRSNKDLGRVLAIARLAMGRDEDALQSWPALWKTALQDRFPDEWRVLAGRAGQGLRVLLANEQEQDLEQALYTCANGLLASKKPTLTQLRITGGRLLQDAIKPLEAEARKRA